MSISVVNGYFCENSCDVAKAKKGEDPHPKVGSEADKTDGEAQQSVAESLRVDEPAVVLGGALAQASSSSIVGDPPPVPPETIGTPMALGGVIDILA